MNPTIFYIYYFITYYIEKNLKKENFRKNKQKKKGRDCVPLPRQRKRGKKLLPFTITDI